MNHNGPADLILFTLSWVNRTTKSQVFKHLIQATNGTKNLYSLPPPYPVWQAERHVSTKGLSALTSKVGRNELEKARRCKSVYCVITYVFLQNGVPIRNSAPWARGSPISCDRVLPGRTVIPMLTVPSAQLPVARDRVFLIPTCCPASHRVWRTAGSSECQPAKGTRHPQSMVTARRTEWAGSIHALGS